MTSAYDARSNYQEIAKHLESVMLIVKYLGENYYWPDRIGENVHYALLDTNAALEELV